MAGTQLDRLIGILAEPDPQTLVGLIGILKAGCGFVPIDPRYPDERVAWILDDCACNVLVTQRRHLARAVKLARNAAGLRDVVCLDGEAGDEGTQEGVAVHVLNGLASPGPAGNGRDPRELRSLAYVVYTSGSTGRPKGVPISHENLVPMLVWGCEALGLGEGTRVLQSLSFCFDFGIFELLTTLLAGGTLCFPGEAAGDPAAFAREIARQGINTVHTTPAFAREFAASGGSLGGLEVVHLGGEALSRDTVARIRAVAPRSTVYNGYGPTEATVNSSIFRVGAAEDAGLPVIPIGRRSADNALYVLDRADHLVPFGARGELHVGGIGVARGYLKRPDLTAERFVPDPFGTAPGGRLYRTGDLVRYLPGGDIEFLGRIDQQVKVRGFRVEPGEIEAVLREHPEVRDAVVVAHAELSGDKRLVAYVVTDTAAVPELRSFLCQRLPSHMVPLAFLLLPELPLTATGKVDRRALPAPAEAGRQAGSAERTPPRNPVEELLAGIWCRCLGVDQVGVYDDFFELGGHSLLLTQVTSHIRKEMGVEVPLQAFFEAPVLADLAEAVERASRAEMPPIVPVPRDGDLPLSFAQERLWFLARLDPESLAYHVPRVVRITGDYRPPAMELAYEALVERHEILRTVLREVDGRPVQHILPPRPFRVLEADLSGLDPSARREELERLIASEVRRPFDLVNGPMLRAVLVRMGPEEYTQIQTEHHLVHDGWTQGVLLDDLLALYAGFYEGRRVELRPLPVQYADFAVWQRQWLASGVLERELSYWKERLAGMPPVFELPADRPRPPVQSHRGSTLFFEFSASLLEGLHELSRREGVTPFMVFFGGYAALLHRHSGSLDLVVGTAIANRTNVETEGLIGFFVNTLLLRTDFGGSPSVRELLRRLRSTTLGAYAHQQLPFEKLVEELDPERDLSHTPLCQVMFLLQNAPLPPLELPGVRLEYREVENGTAKFDLTLSLQERNGILGGWLEFGTDLFDAATIERFRDHLERMFVEMAAAPERPVAELPLLSDAEQLALVAGWNDAPPAQRNRPLLHEWFAGQAARRPDAVALVHRGEPVTYGALAERVGRIAACLAGLGVGPEVRVGVLLEPGADLPAALLGVLAAGGAYVPLDPSHPAERLATILEDSGMSALLTQSSLAGLLPPDALPHVPRIRLDAETLPEPDGRAAAVTPDNLAYVIFTSGSTGRPKGVEVPHGALVNFLRSMQERPGLGPDDVLLATTTVAFDIAALELFLPLVTGARVVLVGRDVAADGRRLAAELPASGATVMQATPATWSLLFEAGWEGAQGLRVLCGGEALPRPLADRLVATCGEVWNLYGPTETTVWSGVSRVSPGLGPVTVDRPVAGTELYALDPAFGPAPLGVPGELAIGGAGLARGYRGRADLTAERFVPDPLSGRPGARLYRTGDLARRLADGRIEFLGRLDHQIKLRGFRIELGEIEASLGAHAAVAECAAVLRDDPATGPQIVAYVVPALSGSQAESREAASVAEWSAVWDDAYREGSDDPTFDISGWNSSVTGEPLGSAQMGEWVAGTVERILALEPERVLEIGCGTGLLLHRIAPRVRSYCATDVSPRVVERLARQVAAAGSGLGHVTVTETRADALEGFAPGAFDVVVLNSVVQYFPSVDYLLKVLDRVVPLVAPGGAVFLGDIRSLLLLEAFRLEVELERAPDGLTLQELRRRVNGAVAAERELVLDPRFFHALARRIPAVAGIGVQVKRGRFRNELNKFRYDVVLRLAAGDLPGAPPAAPDAVDWQEAGLTLPGLRSRLAQLEDRALAVRRIPDARLRRDLEALRHLRESRAATVGDLREAARRAGEDGAVEPHDLWALAEELGLGAAVTWSSGSGAEGLCDAVFSASGPWLAPPLPLPVEPWSRYANSPRAAAPAQRLAPELAEHLRERLPGYMVPGTFVFLDALPLNPSGKVDRRALPAPDLQRQDSASFSPPQTPVEELLASIWAAVLGRDRVGRNDDFFQLGGHSLKAVQVTSRVHKLLGVDLPVRTLFEAPTLAGLAARTEAARREGTADSAPPLVPVPRQGDLPLSFSQQRLWFLDRLEAGDSSYHLGSAAVLRGRLDAAALDRALAEVVRRHETLRCTFRETDGRPAVVLVPPAEVLIPRVDLRGLEDAEAAEAALIAAELARPFDLERGPLFRTLLLQRSAAEHLLFVSMHHIVTDGWSMGVFLRELGRLYAAFERGDASPLPEPPLGYIDYAAWQRRWLQGDALASRVELWKAQLAGAPTALDLPADRSRPAVRSSRSARELVRLPAELARGLAALAQERGATLFMVLLAGFSALLERYGGQQDLLVGSPVANRPHPELEGLIGFFANTLVLRSDLSGRPTAEELLARVREVTLTAYSRQDVPFEKLVEEFQPQRDLSRTPLFQVMLTLQNAPLEPLELPDLSFLPVEIEARTAPFDWLLQLRESERGLGGKLDYSTDLFDRTTAVRALGHLRRMLEGMVAEPSRPVASLPLLAEEESHQLLHEWNDSGTEHRDAGLLHELIEAQAARTPEAPALVFQGAALSYRELDAWAGRLAWRLRSLGIDPESRVGVAMERSFEMVVSLLAVLKAGGAYVPLDPSYPAERLSYMLEDAAADLVLTQRGLEPLLAGWPGRRILAGEDREEAEPAPGRPESRLSPSNLAYVIYTSGSTGQPKGAMNTHGAIVNRLLWMQRAYGLGSNDQVLQKTPFSFDVSVWEFFWPLMTGACLVLARPEGHKDAAYLVRLIREQEITTLHFVPSMLQVFLEEEGLESCSSLRRVICSGEALPVELQRRCLARLPAELHNLYGPTEAAVDVTSWRCRPEGGRHSVPIGRPIDNTRILILDRDLAPAPVGVAGELHIGGAGLARGYLGKPDLTAERFVPDPHGAPGDRLYRTGDLARLRRDGAVEFLGRLDFQVKVRGFRIELGEIESVLAAHPGVREAVVLVRQDVPGLPRLVAYLVERRRGELDLAEVRAQAVRKLPDHMVPSAFVVLAELPLTPNGKLDRRALPAPEPAGDLERFVAPSTAAERSLARIWSELLHVDRVGAQDNFFALGGDSIASIQMVSRARKAGLVLTARQVFQHQTVAALAAAAALEAERSALDGPALAAPVLDQAALDLLVAAGGEIEDLYPLSPVQQGILFHTLQEPGSGLYFQQLSWRLEGPLDDTAFEQAWQAVLQRNPVLRTAFAWELGGEPLQVVYRRAPFALEREDWRGLGEGEQCERLESRLRESRACGFDLSLPPLMSVTLIRLAGEAHQLVWNHHHLLLDGWSLSLLLQEVFTCYAALRDGGEPPCRPALPFRDYIAWLRSRDASQAESFWRRTLAGWSTPTLLGSPPSSGPKTGEVHGERSLELPAEATAGLQALARRSQVTLSTLVQGAWALLMGRHLGTEEEVFGAVSSGRSAPVPGIEEMLGVFIHTHPVRVGWERGQPVEDWLRRLQESQAELRQYEYAALPDVQRWSGVGGGQALFDCLLVFQNYPVDESLRHPGGDLAAREVRYIERTNYPLTLTVSPGERLRVKAVYERRRFAPGAVARLLEHLRTLLEGMVELGGRSRVGDLPWWTAGERHQILEWNDTSEIVLGVCVHGLFESQARRCPEAVAVEMGERRWSYGELEARSNRLARHLAELGVGLGSLVGVCLERSPEMVASLLGVLKTGAAYVPLDPTYPAERLSYVLQDAGVEVLLSDLGLVSSATARVVEVGSEEAEVWRCGSAEPLGLSLSAEDLAYVIYTSGSTGRPKGVSVRHGGVVSFLESMARRPGLSAGDTVLAVTTISFDIAGLELYLPLSVGARVVLASREEAVEGSRLAGALAASGATLLQATPVTWRLLVDSGWEGDGRLKALCGGEALGRDLALALAGRVGELWNVYGPTETTIWSMQRRVLSDEPLPAVVPVGRPLANTAVHLLDADLESVALGSVGELYIGGAGLARGYHGRPDLTAERFVPDPFASEAGGRLYRTGDLARRLGDGDIEFLGRSDHQVKLRGFRIELGEIEAALVQHPQVRQSVVVPRGERLVAYFVARNGGAVAGEVLRSFLRGKLPEPMVPGLFLALEALPLTPNGKVDRKALPNPEGVAARQQPLYVAPETETERAIAAILRDVLALDRIGVQDNFFDIGGNSLHVIQAWTRLQQMSGRQFPMVTLFQHPTISSLTDFLTREEPTARMAALEQDEERGRKRRESLRRRPLGNKRESPAG